MPTNTSLQELIEKGAEFMPRAVAVEISGDVLTYEQLNRRSNQLAEYLRRSGVRPGTTVAVVMDLSIDHFIATLAVLKAGAIFLPVDPHGSSEWVNLESAGVVLTDNNQSLDLGDCNAIDVSSERGLIACMPDCNLPKNEAARYPFRTQNPIYREASPRIPQVTPIRFADVSSFPAKAFRPAAVGRSITLTGLDKISD